MLPTCVVRIRLVLVFILVPSTWSQQPFAVVLDHRNRGNDPG
jgi:hypothetical protein